MLKIFRKDRKESFFSNVIFDIEESEEMHEILLQSRIDKSTAENMEGAMKVIYKNNVADEMIWIVEGDYLEVEKVRFNKTPITYRDYPINDYKSIIANENGIHQLGGKPPNGFQMPENITTAPNIYLGVLKCSNEESLKWTGAKELHLVCPIHADIEILYLDYSNPVKPKLLNQGERNSISSAYDDLTSEDQIVFKPLPVKLEKLSLDFIYEDVVLGNTGSPAWIQNEIIPKCPKTGKSMRFLVALETNSSVELESSTFKSNDDYMKQYVETYDFWGSGALYIFFNPESKVMAYFIQNT